MAILHDTLWAQAMINVWNISIPDNTSWARDFGK